MAVNKVYIVKTYQGSFDDAWWNIHCICSDPYKAEEKKRELEKSIELIKAEYENEFGRSYDEDAESVMDMDQEDRWEKFYTYQFKHELLKITDIYINEHEVL